MSVSFGPIKDTFGLGFLQSFLNHVNCFQTVNYLCKQSPILDLKLSDTPKISVFDFFELENTNNIKFNDINIVIIETLRQLYVLCDNNKLDFTKKYIILSESFWDINEHKFTKLTYELIYVPFDLTDFQSRLTNRSSLYFYLNDLNLLDSYNPSYDFLCLVGRSKDWRNKFVKKLQEIDLSNTLTSYYGKCLGNTELLNIDIDYDRDSSIEEFEKKFYKPIKIKDFDFNYNLSHFTKMELYYKTKFSLIVETEAKLTEYHITEKTLKCLILGHPFVVVSSFRYLKFLRSMGFKTYDSIIDESYDEIENLDFRINKIIEIVKNLKNIKFNINTLRDIQNHNINNFVKFRNNHSYIHFLECVKNA